MCQPVLCAEGPFTVGVMERVGDGRGDGLDLLVVAVHRLDGGAGDEETLGKDSG